MMIRRILRNCIIPKPTVAVVVDGFAGILGCVPQPRMPHIRPARRARRGPSVLLFAIEHHRAANAAVFDATSIVVDVVVVGTAVGHVGIAVGRRRSGRIGRSFCQSSSRSGSKRGIPTTSIATAAVTTAGNAVVRFELRLQMQRRNGIFQQPRLVGIGIVGGVPFSLDGVVVGNVLVVGWQWRCRCGGERHKGQVELAGQNGFEVGATANGIIIIIIGGVGTLLLILLLLLIILLGCAAVAVREGRRGAAHGFVKVGQFLQHEKLARRSSGGGCGC